jgi:glycosyltransferase involved in cell wall biosynthesis
LGSVLDHRRAVHVPSLVVVEPLMISVVIPAYNSGPYIAEAIRSVMMQTYPDWELIVVDDGSTDDTVEQVKPFLSDSRISFHHKVNGGPSSARNYGIHLAKGDLIALLDADDYWLPTKLENQIVIMDQYPEVGVCGTQRALLSPAGDIRYYPARRAFHGRAFPRLLFEPLADMSSALIRRSVFEKVGLFDESLRLAEDYEFWLRVGIHFTFHIIPEPLECYRSRESSAAVTKWKNQRAVFSNYILPRFLNEQGGRQYVRPWHLWKLKAQHYKYQGDESNHRLARLGWYLRSIVTYPLSLEPYHALGGTILPARLWRLVKALKNNHTL